MTENEDRYETFEFIIKERSSEDGESWFDKVHDFLVADCEPVLDENGEQVDCTCGMISGGGFAGTLDGCYDHNRVSEKWATVQTDDLKKILLKIEDLIIGPRYGDLSEEDIEAYNRLKEEAYWHDNFQEWLDNLPDDEEDEEFELDDEFKPYFSNEPLPDIIIKGDW